MDRDTDIQAQAIQSLIDYFGIQAWSPNRVTQYDVMTRDI